MQRINISVDMENNEILSKEIEKAIKGAVKAKTREFFNEELEEEVKRIADNTLKKWNERGYYSKETPIEKEVKSRIDAGIKEMLGEITVSRRDIDDRIEEKIKDIGSSIDYAVGVRVEKLAIKDYVKEVVVSAVRKLYPQEILRLAEQKEIEDLRQRVKELETENEALRNGKQEEL